MWAIFLSVLVPPCLGQGQWSSVLPAELASNSIYAAFSHLAASWLASRFLSTQQLSAVQSLPGHIWVPPSRPHPLHSLCSNSFPSRTVSARGGFGIAFGVTSHIS